MDDPVQLARNGGEIPCLPRERRVQVFKLIQAKALRALRGATDVTGFNGTQAAAAAVVKTLTLDLVQVLSAYGVKPEQIPATIEGLSFGPDVIYNGGKVHTLWVADDNDFLQDSSGPGTNPNQFFVFAFTDANLNGSHDVPQRHTAPF